MGRRLIKARIKQSLRRLAPEWMYLRWLVWRYGNASKTSDVLVLEQYLDPTRAAVDVGANRGVWIQMMAGRCTHVHAYEPDAQMFRFARRHAPSNVTVHHCALSDSAGEAVLTTPIWDGAASRTHGSLSKDFSAYDTVTQTVPTRRLDAEDLHNVGFIKIDVEGHEMAVLRGAEGLLREQEPAMWIEVEPRHGSDPQTVATFLEGLGYRGFFYWQGKRRPVSEYEAARHAAASGGFGVVNFLYLPASRADDL